MIGRIMIARTMPAVSDRAAEAPLAVEERDPAEVLVQPLRRRRELRHQEDARPTGRRRRLGTAASRSIDVAERRARRRGA